MTSQNSRPLYSIVLPLIAIISLLLVIAWMAGMFTSKIVPGNEQVVSVPVGDASSFYEVKIRQYAQIETVNASIEAKHNIDISSRILARVEKIFVSAGDLVKKGQVLVELEKGDLKSRLEQAQAKLQSINARLLEAKKNLHRVRDLSSKGVVAVAQLDAVKANYDATVADRNKALQAVKEAKASLSYATITSPIDGLIIDRSVESGDTVQPTRSILRLYNPTSIRIEANVRETLAVNLKVGDVLKANIPSLNKTLSAAIEEIVPTAHSASRSFLIKARLSDVAGLLPGMFAKLEIPDGRLDKILIPQNFVMQIGQLDVVWVEVDGKLLRRFVRIGDQTDNGLVEVISGLKDGEKIKLLK